MPVSSSLWRLFRLGCVVSASLIANACATTGSSGIPIPDAPVARHASVDTSKPATSQPVADVAAAPASPDTGPLPPDDTDDQENDPFEGFNRSMFRFNQNFDKYLGKPVATAYEHVVPNAIKRGISNFFNNLLQPTVIFNDLLQAKFGDTASATGRFVLNSTVGVLGVFDVATHVGWGPQTEDFGQTLAVWGVGDGPYLVLPIFGPRNIRDGVGLVTDWYTHPATYIQDNATRWGTFSLAYIDTRAQLLGATSVLEQAAGEDQYIFLREAYRQRRLNLIYDGNPPPPKFE